MMLTSPDVTEWYGVLMDVTAYLAAPFGVKAADVQHHPHRLQVYLVSVSSTRLGRHEADAVFALPLACEQSQHLPVHHTASHNQNKRILNIRYSRAVVLANKDGMTCMIIYST